MKVIIKCVVCGTEFVQTKNKNSTGCCSPKCRERRNSRLKKGYPVSDKEYEIAKKNGHLTSKEQEDKPRKETMDDCLHPDCYYRCEHQPITCDYIIYEGVRRGCKISECDKYRPRFNGYEAEKRKVLNLRRY